jgi:hypothetical protein
MPRNMERNVVFCFLEFVYVFSLVVTTTLRSIKDALYEIVLPLI